MIHLEEYIDTLEALPMELQRQFTLMRELDALSQDIQDQMKQSTEEFVNNPPTKDDPKHVEYLRNFTQLFSTVLKHGEEKVALATQTYDLVDKHIRKLDDDLAKFEDRQLAVPRILHRWGPGGVNAPGMADAADDTYASDRRPASSGRRGDTPSARKKKLTQRDSSPQQQTNGKAGTPSSKRGRGGGGHSSAVSSRGGIGGSAGANGSDSGSRTRGAAKVIPQVFADMPIDPNEPRYCYCQQVSYGEMVACDDEDCKIEWFHLDCVDLKAPPKGQWFCNDCSQKYKKHRDRHHHS